MPTDAKAMALATAATTLNALRSVGDFQLNIRAQIRIYWRGGSQVDFTIGIMNAIDRGFRQAWRAGAAEFGIRPDDYSAEEIDELQRRINDQFAFVASFAACIIPQSQGGRLSDAFRMADLWTARYEEVRNAARVMAARNAPLEWVLGVAEHCSSCMKLAGKVKRARWWQDNGILPRRPGAPYLECRGYRCQCSLVRTDKPLSRGAMPGLP